MRASRRACTHGAGRDLGVFEPGAGRVRGSCGHRDMRRFSSATRSFPSAASAASASAADAAAAADAEWDGAEEAAARLSGGGMAGMPWRLASTLAATDAAGELRDENCEGTSGQFLGWMRSGRSEVLLSSTRLRTRVPAMTSAIPSVSLE